MRCAHPTQFTARGRRRTRGRAVKGQDEGTVARMSVLPQGAVLFSRDLDAVQLEMHGYIAITYRKYVPQRTSPAAPGRAELTRVVRTRHALRDGAMAVPAHRTVHGPTYATRATAAK